MLKAAAALLFILAILFTIGAVFLRAGSPDVAAHQYAESVLYPDCVAKLNNWAFNHPISDPQHLGKVDVKDRTRFELARKTCEKFYSEMDRAAY